jgi:hypothetical protein
MTKLKNAAARHNTNIVPAVIVPLNLSDHAIYNRELPSAKTPQTRDWGHTSRKRELENLQGITSV